MHCLSNQPKPLFLGRSNRQSFATEMLFIFLSQCTFFLSIHNQLFIYYSLLFNPFTPKSDLIDFTLSYARRFYLSKGDPLGVKGLKKIGPDSKHQVQFLPKEKSLSRVWAHLPNIAGINRF